MKAAFFLPCLLVAALLCAGCTAPAPSRSSFSVSPEGVLSLTCAPVTSTEDIIVKNDTYTKSRIVMHTENGDVIMYLGAPESPKAAMVYVPGAGEKIAGHEERMVRYSSAGYAFLFVDIRGNRGETPGLPFSQQLIGEDYEKYRTGEMPQYYLSICDLENARKMLSGRFGVPVYAAGSSNGGRYAAVAAGVDPQFAGYIGISTSDWGLLASLWQQGVSGDPLQFAASIEPGTYLGKISPRPVWIYHNATDPIIPFENGRQFFEKASEPKNFSVFDGDHGISPDTDRRILMQRAQIYGNRG